MMMVHGDIEGGIMTIAKLSRSIHIIDDMCRCHKKKIREKYLHRKQRVKSQISVYSCMPTAIMYIYIYIYKFIVENL